MNSIYYNPLFGLILSMGTYIIASILYNKYRLALLNPLLLSITFSILVLLLLEIPLEAYQTGGSLISFFLVPATALLAVNIFKKLQLLKDYILPILAGCFAGCLTSIICIVSLCKLFGLNDIITLSLIPKSVTTPIAIQISEKLGGTIPITMAAVIITGILGSLICPVIIKFLHINNKIAAGLGIGTCSHAVGTSKALELGEVQGAASSIGISILGIMTSLLALFLPFL